MQGLSNASTDHFFERILDDIREQQNAASDLLSQLSPYSLDQSEEVFVRLLRRMERKQLLLVLVIDEFESAFQNPLFNQAFFDRLRAYAQDWRLAYLLATQKSVDFRPELITSPFSSPFFNFFHTLTLQGYAEKEAETILRSVSAQTGRQFSNPELEVIERFGGNFPFFLNIAADQVHRNASQGNRKLDLEIIYRNMLHESSLYANFEYYLHNLHKDQRHLLYQISASPMVEPVPHNQQPALRWLTRMNLIIPSPTGEYVPFSEALRDYIMNRQSVDISEAKGRHPYPYGSDRLDDESFDALLKILLSDDENEHVEFKVAAKWNAKINKSDNQMKDNIIETTAAFMNTHYGGLLIVGVDKNNNLIGLEDDFRAADEQKNNRDGYELFLRNVIHSTLGGHCTLYYDIVFHTVDGKHLCCIRVAPAPIAIYYEGNLWVRDGNGKRRLNAQEAAQYAQQRWPKPGP